MGDTEKPWETQERERREGIQSSGKAAPSNVKPADQTTAIAPKKTGRGMMPGESVSDWKARLKKMDEENEIQQKALTK